MRADNQDLEFGLIRFDLADSAGLHITHERHEPDGN